MKVIIFLTCCLIYPMVSIGQTCKCNKHVFYPGVVNLQNFKAPDTIVKNYNSTILQKYYILDCFGTMKYEKTDTLGNLIETGNLISNKKIVEKLVPAYEITTGVQTGVRKSIYYQPYKQGTWKYYQNGSIVKEEIYEKDSLINVKIYK